MPLCRVYCALLVFSGLITFYRAKQARYDAPVIDRRFWRGNGAKPRIGDSPSTHLKARRQEDLDISIFGDFDEIDWLITLDRSVDLIWQHFLSSM